MRNRIIRRVLGTGLALAALGALAGCPEENGGAPAGGNNAAGAGAAAKESYVIGVIAKSQSNPVFQAARQGAEDAARQLSEQYGIDVKIDWRTPNQEDAQQQAQFVETLTSAGVDGISISCSDANLLTSALNNAVDRGVEIVTFDSDAPDSRRFAYYGVDDRQAGVTIMQELARVMGDEGVVAILSGNPNAPNLSARVQGVRDEAANHEDIQVLDVFYAPEQATDMAAKMQQVQTSNPSITGWALVGGWPLYTDNALDGIHETAKVVSMDPLPLPLEYLKKGQVQVLVGQPYYGWGYESVRLIVDKLHKGETPDDEKVFADFDIVTSENVDEFIGRWEEWLGGN